MTAQQPEHPDEKCHECPQFFKCEELPPCARPHTPAPAEHEGKSDFFGTPVSHGHFYSDEYMMKHDAAIARTATLAAFEAIGKEICYRFHLKPRPYDPTDSEIPQIGLDELAEILDAAKEQLQQAGEQR